MLGRGPGGGPGGGHCHQMSFGVVFAKLSSSCLTLLKNVGGNSVKGNNYKTR